MKKIYIRVDGNEIIATGHVMRCLSIAEELRELGAEVTFVVADDRPCKLIEDRGFASYVLNSTWNDLNSEIEILLRYIRDNQVEYMLLDSYYVTKEYLDKISEEVEIAYIDDLRRFPYSVRTIICYSPWIDISSYEKLYNTQEHNISFLLGSNYIPLRKEFSNVFYEVREAVQKILITTGGTDQLNLAGSFLKEVFNNQAFENMEFHIVAGYFNKNIEMLRKLADSNSNIIIHENVTQMSELMKLCDVAISAGGTTLYELCACGIPTICVEIADNQNGCRIWEDEGYMYYAGNMYIDKEGSVRNIIDKLQIYCKNYNDRKNKSENMRRLIDGMGSKRIACYMMNGGTKNVK